MAQDERNRDLNDGEREIDLIELLAYLVRHSRLLIFALIAGLIIGTGISAGSYFYRQIFAKEADEALINKAKSSLANEREYLQNGILPNIDPYSEGYASANVFVEAEDAGFSLSIGADNTVSYSNTIDTQIMQEYGHFINGSIAFDSLADEMDTKSSYLAQTVSFSSNDTSGYFTVSVRHVDEESAEKVLDFVLTQLLNQQEVLSANLPPHTLTVSDKVVVTRVDSSLFPGDDTTQKEITDASFKNSYTVASEERISKLNAYIANRQRKISKKTVLMGGGIGLFSVLMLLSLHAILTGVLLSEKSAESFLGTMTMIAFPHSRNMKKRRWFDKIADNLLGVSYGVSDNQIYQALAEILYTHFMKPDHARPGESIGEKKMREIYSETGSMSDVRDAVKEMKVKKSRFLIMGDSLPEGEVKRLAKYLNKDDLPGMEFDCMEQFQERYETIDKIHDADYVILCVKVGSSSHMTLRKFLNTLKLYRKSVFGVVVFN